MICRDIDTHMRGQGDWVDWAQTTDTFKAGKPDKPVTKVAVAWKASWAALKEAHSRGAELFVSHESICVKAQNGSSDPERTFALESELPKFDWLDETGLTVYRCHDVWDRFPEIGIRDTWQKRLFPTGKIIAADDTMYVTQIDPLPLGDLAHQLVDKLTSLGQNGIMVTGDLEREVSRVGTGTGAITRGFTMQELGADVGILSDDYFTHVRMGIHTTELDFPFINVNHGVAEEWGMANLAAYLGETFPDLEVFHIPQKCTYTIIT